MHKTLKYIIPLVLSVFFLAGKSQTVQLKAELSRAAILPGDTVTLSVTAQKPEGLNVKLPEYVDFLPEAIELIQSYNLDSVKQGNQWLLKQAYVITAFDSGFYEISGIRAAIYHNGQVDSLQAAPVFLTVNLVEVDLQGEPKDIFANEEAPITFEEIVKRFYWYIIAFFVLLAAGIGYWYYLKKLREREANAPVIKPKEPAHRIAIRELDELKAKKLWQQEKFKAFYTQLTNILRKYLWLRYDVSAQEMTTDEIMDAFRGRGLLKVEQHQKLREILELADFVKFAKLKPDPDQNNKSFEEALQFVIDTKKAVLEETKPESEQLPEVQEQENKGQESEGQANHNNPNKSVS